MIGIEAAEDYEDERQHEEFFNRCPSQYAFYE